jgi:hypothetical protein
MSELTATVAGGRTITYRARWESFPLPGGDSTASISATSYLAVDGGPDRPVVFLFNGGPGASSMPLHMQAFGPHIMRTWPDGQRTIRPNEHTLLDCADLVFVDPVGTGFNPEIPPGTGHRYLAVAQDAAAVGHLIRQWLVAHDRVGAPIHLVGESYGGFRLATLCESIADLPVAGLVFVSPLLDASAATAAPGNDLPFVFALPSMAVAAAHHGRTADGSDPVSVFQQAKRFARTEYLGALYQGGDLGGFERRRVAQRVARLIGLGVDQVLDADLRVQLTDFVRTLLIDQDQWLGRVDSRVSGPAPRPREAGRPVFVDDPALGLGGSTVRRSDLVAEHLRTIAGAPADGSYITLSLELNFRFDHRAPLSDDRYADATAHYYRNPTAHVADLLRARPDTRVLAIGGYYDLAVPLASIEHALAHAGLPADRVDLLRLVSGHSLDDTVLPEAAAALRRLINPIG